MRKRNKKCGIKCLFCCIFFCITFFSGTVSAQVDEIVQQANRHYQPQTWKVSDQIPVQGIKLDDFNIPGFALKNKLIHPFTGGYNYIWLNKSENLEIDVIVTVCKSNEASRNAMLNWLTMGVNTQFSRGTFTGMYEEIGDISWIDSKFLTMAFVRDNIFIIIQGKSNKSEHRQIVDEVAMNIDNAIKAVPRHEYNESQLKNIYPGIKSVALAKKIVKLNDLIKLDIDAVDPRGDHLDFIFYSTGGNVLRLKDGYYFQPTIPGTHTIKVTAISQFGLKTTKDVEISVAEK